LTSFSAGVIFFSVVIIGGGGILVLLAHFAQHRDDSPAVVAAKLKRQLGLTGEEEPIGTALHARRH
jgi:hypothetical protein